MLANDDGLIPGMWDLEIPGGPASAESDESCYRWMSMLFRDICILWRRDLDPKVDGRNIIDVMGSMRGLRDTQMDTSIYCRAYAAVIQIIASDCADRGHLEEAFTDDSVSQGRNMED